MSNTLCKSIRSGARLAALLVGTAILATGCATVANITIPATKGAIEGSPEAATVVVVQPTTRYVAVSVLDGDGKLLGQLHNRSHTVVRVPPGPVSLYVLSERQVSWGDRIKGEVLAGRVYYATISVRYGGLRFNSLNPSSPDGRWEQRENYLARTPRVEMDPAMIATAVERLGNTGEILRVIDDKYADRYQEHQIEAHTIRPEDGL